MTIRPSVAVGLLADITAIVLTDDHRLPDIGKTDVRFIHASPDAPAGMSINVSHLANLLT